MTLQLWPIIVDQYTSGKVPYLSRSGMQVLLLSLDSIATIASVKTNANDTDVLRREVINNLSPIHR